ncbi:MAG: hypothetical protein QOF32_454 [Gammaproteobacteria bacterium]|nr:hypothetical protein [Gammaproteobacteria bacterium]
MGQNAQIGSWAGARRTDFIGISEVNMTEPTPRTELIRPELRSRPRDGDNSLPQAGGCPIPLNESAEFPGMKGYMCNYEIYTLSYTYAKIASYLLLKTDTYVI